jgi:hypothetical protein
MVRGSPFNTWDGIIVIKTAIISYTIICDRVGLTSPGAASAQVSGVPPRTGAQPPRRRAGRRRPGCRGPLGSRRARPLP